MFDYKGFLKFNQCILIIKFAFKYLKRHSNINCFTTFTVHNTIKQSAIILPTATHAKTVLFKGFLGIAKGHLLSLYICFQMYHELILLTYCSSYYLQKDRIRYI